MYWHLANSIVILITFIFVMFLLFRNRKLVRQNLELASILQSTKAELDDVRNEMMTVNVQQQQSVVALKQQQQEVLQHLEQVVSSLSTLAEQSNAFRQDYEQVKHQVQLLKSESSEQKLYGRAKKMIEMGAEIEELMLECDVPRAEAELLLSLYKTN